MNRNSPRAWRMTFGDIAVTTLHDGRLDSAFSDYRGISEAEMSRLLLAAGAPVPPMTNLNVFLVETDGRRMLIDSGAGAHLADTAGNSAAILSDIGVEPTDIDIVLISHLHSDHVAGISTPQGEPIFSRAEIWMHEAEKAFWLDQQGGALAGPLAAKRDFAVARLKPYAGQIRTFADGRLFPGVEAILLRGHTPGHCGFFVGSGSDRVLVAGDFVHLPEVQIPRPDVTTTYDVEPDLAEASRRRVLESAADQDMVVAGMHLRWPPFVRIRRTQNGFEARAISS